MSETLLINHCSPTLAGIKTGNMFSCSYTCKNELNYEIRRLNRILVPKGLRIIPLRIKNGKALIYVYRPSKLSCDLDNHLAAKLLRQCGYSGKNGNACLAELISKMDSCESFPHEIGLFLGYPPEDVSGFINDKPHSCKYSGFWKVYSDVDTAKKTFAKYVKCREIYCRRWNDGFSLEKLTVCV